MNPRPDRGEAADACAAAPPVNQAGVYLTDGIFLYRVDHVLMTGAGEMADIEDCYRLGVVRVLVNDLRARRLRVVTPDARRQAGGTATCLTSAM